MKLISKKPETVIPIDHVATGLCARNERIARKKTLRVVAELMGISAPYLHDLEMGRRLWTEGKVRRFNEAMRAAW